MNDRQLFDQIDRILWEDWDPIGLNKKGGPVDEYRGYVPSIISVLKKGADLQKIADSLNHHASVNMGLSAPFDHHEKIAVKLKALVR
jgi:hypothetical protein